MFWQSRNYSKCFDNRNNKAEDRKGMKWIHSQMGTGIRGFLSWEWSGTGIPAHLWLLVNEMLLIQGIQFCKNSFLIPPVPEIWIAKDRKTSPPFDKTKRNRASEIWSGRLLGSMINDVWRNERPTHMSEQGKEKQKAGKPRVKGQLRMKTIRKSKKKLTRALKDRRKWKECVWGAWGPVQCWRSAPLSGFALLFLWSVNSASLSRPHVFLAALNWI